MGIASSQGFVSLEEEQNFISSKRSTRVRGSCLGAVCSAFWLLAVIMIDIHPFRFRIEAVRQRNASSMPQSTVIFPLLMTENVFFKMAIVSTFSKILKLLILFTQFLRVPKLANIINTFFLIDHYLRKNFLMDESTFCKMKRSEGVHFWAVLSSSLALIWFSFLCMEYNSSESLANKILIFIDDLTLMTIFTMEIQLYGFCKLLKERLALLNFQLKCAVDYLADKYHQRTNDLTEAEYKLEAILVVFWKLIDLLDVVVKTYRLQIFFGLCLTFLHLLIDIYLTMYSIMESKNSTWMQALNAKPLRYIFRLALISVAGSSIRKQVKKTRVVLTRHDLNVFRKQIKEKIRVFFVRLNQRNVNLSVYCILHLDLPLMISFVEGISSYILIMLQYKWIGK